MTQRIGKIVFAAAVFLLFWSVPVSAKSSFPRLANIYLRTPIKDSQVSQLAQWDVLIFHMLAQQNSAAAIRKIRQLNPDVKILVYIASEEFPILKYKDWDTQTGTGLFYQLLSGITDEMWLRDRAGNYVVFWQDFWMLNVSDYPSSRARWNDYLSSFVAEKLLASGLWDGVFYDNVWTGVSHINGADIDIDNDNLSDSKQEIDNSWQAGMKKLFALTRQKAGGDIIIVGNGDRGFYDDINGLYIENFTDDNLSWAERMKLYKLAVNSVNPVFTIVGNTNLNSTNSDNYQKMRFGLASALLENGYYAFDAGSNTHAETWWYDEYDIDLGEPLSPSKSKNSHDNYQPDIWQRSFSHGLAVVNSTGNQQAVDLGGEYEKIHGAQDAKTNDGSIVSETVIDSYDGLLLLKTFDSLDDVLFRNGDFVRFFDAGGNRVRNGFFIFDANYKGGDLIARLDLDGNGRRDLLVVSGNKIMAWRDDGQPFLRLYPYTANYRGRLRVALGDLDRNKNLEIYVSPAPGYPAPLKIFNHYGQQIKPDWYPYGTNYAGGYSIAVLENRNPIESHTLAVGKASQEPLISLYNSQYGFLSQFYAFNFKSTFGLNLAAGNLDGDLYDELLVGAGQGGQPVIRVFDREGRQLGKEFSAYSSLGAPGIEVLAVDVNYDGREDIVAMSAGF